MCGVDDTSVWRLGATGRIAHTIFHNYYESQEPVLEADDDASATWNWRERASAQRAHGLPAAGLVAR